MSYTMVSAIFHVLGIYLTRQTGFVTIFTISLLSMAVYAIMFRKKASVAVFIACSMTIIGGISYSLAERNSLYEAFPDKYVTVSGTVVSAPAKSSDQFKYEFEIDTLSYLGTTIEPDQRIFLRTENEYSYGDILEVSGFLTEITAVDNQYEYDYALSYRSRGIYNQITAFEDKKTGENKSPRLLPGKFRSTIYKSISQNYPEDIAGIYSAIILGEKDYIQDELTTGLLRSGVWQSLYSPYIHLTLLLLLIASFFKSKKARHTAIIPLLAVYALLNLDKPNTLKASLLLLMVTLAKKFMGYSDKMQQLSILVLIMTIINPMLCYNRGFVMSVLCTVILFIFYPTVHSIILSRFKQKLRKVASVLSIAITLCLCTFPISAYLFNGTATYSTIITTLMIPVILLIILTSLVHLPLLCTFGTGVFTNGIMLRLLNFIKDLPEKIEKIPFHYIQAPTPSILTVVTAYLILFTVARLIKKKKWDDVTKSLTAVSLGFLICIVPYSFTSGLEIYFVNVGQGDSAILHTQSETILIDGGGTPEYMKSDSNYSVGDKVLLPYLISHGFSVIDYAVVTHFDNDHAEGVISVVRELEVKNIIMPDSSHGNDLRCELETLAKAKNIPIIYAQKGDMFSFASGLRMDVISPDSVRRESTEANDTSIVLNVTYNSFTGLFTGDSTCPANEGFPRYVDILKVAHHGSEKENSDFNIRHICPDYAVISVGENNTYAHPAQSVLDSLESVGAHILRTDKLGDIRFKINKNGKITYETLREEE